MLDALSVIDFRSSELFFKRRENALVVDLVEHLRSDEWRDCLDDLCLCNREGLVLLVDVTQSEQLIFESQVASLLYHHFKTPYESVSFFLLVLSHILLQLVKNDLIEGWLDEVLVWLPLEHGYEDLRTPLADLVRTV